RHPRLPAPADNHPRLRKAVNAFIRRPPQPGMARAVGDMLHRLHNREAASHVILPLQARFHQTDAGKRTPLRREILLFLRQFGATAYGGDARKMLATVAAEERQALQMQLKNPNADRDAVRLALWRLQGRYPGTKAAKAAARDMMALADTDLKRLEEKNTEADRLALVKLTRLVSGSPGARRAAALARRLTWP